MSITYISPNWKIPPSIHAITTTKIGGISKGVYQSNNMALHVGDSDQAVHANRKQICSLFGFDDFATVHQVHGSHIVSAQQAFANRHEADAIYCQEPALACAIMTADCLPIVIASENGSEFAVVHAGWRSLAANIIAKTALHFSANNLLHAWIGPSICQTCYPVGDELRSQLIDYQSCFSPQSDGTWLCNLRTIATFQLKTAGIHYINDSNLCTAEENHLFYSHRLSGITGRMATIAWIK